MAQIIPAVLQCQWSGHVGLNGARVGRFGKNGQTTAGKAKNSAGFLAAPRCNASSGCHLFPSPRSHGSPRRIVLKMDTDAPGLHAQRWMWRVITTYVKFTTRTAMHFSIFYIRSVV